MDYKKSDQAVGQFCRDRGVYLKQSTAGENNCHNCLKSRARVKLYFDLDMAFVIVYILKNVYECDNGATAKFLLY